MDNVERRLAIERYVDAYNRFDVKGMLAELTPDVRFENVSDGEVTASSSGIDEFRRLAELSSAMFSERKQVVTGMAFGEVSVRVGIAWRGVFAVDLPEGPTVGTVIELRGESEFEFSGDRICRIIDRG